MADTPRVNPEQLAALYEELRSRAGVAPPPAKQGYERLPFQDAPDSSAEAGENPETGSGSAGHGAGQTGTYDPLAAARDDQVVIVARLDTITGLLQELREDTARQALHDQQQVVIEQLLTATQQLRSLIGELMKNGTSQGPGLGYATVQQATVMDAEAEDGGRRWPGPAWEKIKDEIKKILPWLWSMISKLVTVKEWTLTGTVGGFPGLAPASVSVTFGR
jgi:hypothetical protein